MAISLHGLFRQSEARAVTGMGLFACRWEKFDFSIDLIAFTEKIVDRRLLRLLDVSDLEQVIAW
ncbi:MAG TPA: hypothetical protein PLG09_02570 [Syntrophomonadaceae bacterium]|nr:hypothetical protein [Syntrophomonadaceae bacterium]HOQ08991.1 hypothetical protein [Syntrophomonadaceae bacterium]HPU47914.1 hypothetical protein [Syntrophomonadaceae bacterium]